ncbi:MAG: nitronate monooxygenase [Bacteroidales bacterium]|jgi:nitronate monooxygenase|nr:nitronate monooxygenase [Bacteroidales bacterium]
MKPFNIGDLKIPVPIIQEGMGIGISLSGLASAMQMGTRFVATEECDASDEFKNAFIEAEEENIQIIKSPVGLPGRTIFNNFLKEAYEGKRKPPSCNYHCIKSCNPKPPFIALQKPCIQHIRETLQMDSPLQEPMLHL